MIKGWEIGNRHLSDLTGAEQFPTSGEVRIVEIRERSQPRPANSSLAFEALGRWNIQRRRHELTDPRA